MQLPLNPFDATFRTFEENVLLEVNRRGMAALGMKSLCGGGLEPWSEERMQALRERCAAFASDGHLELYKSTKKFDGEIGREMRGFPPPQKLPL